MSHTKHSQMRQRASANSRKNPMREKPTQHRSVQQPTMAFFDLTSKDATSIPDSPAAKRQKTAGGYQGIGYTSGDDSSGDDLFDGLTPAVPSKHFTQPTQIIDRSAPVSSPAIVREEVLVPASSPFRAHNIKSSPAQPAAPAGRIASLMAPAGTAFKAPNGIQKALSKPMIIDLDENDGPTYQGGSSDDEIQESTADIKPSIFKARSKISFGSSSSSGRSFRDLLSTFKPISTTAQFERSSATASVNGIQRKPQPQTRPERAVPVGADITLEDITDPLLKRKVERVKGICPQGTKITAIMDALVKCKGYVEDATNMLLASSDVIEILSDNENNKGVAKPKVQLMAAPEPQMKRQLKQPVASIQERYSSTQHQRKIPLIPAPVVATLPKPKKKLMQGRRNPDPSSPVAPIVSPPKKKVPEKIQEVGEITFSDAEDYDSDAASEAEDDPELEGRVLSFLNKCSKNDLIDLVNIKDTVAEFFLSKRPFRDLDIAREVSDAKDTKSGKRSAKTPIGDKIVQTSLNMMSGYEAVDALVSTCSELGKPLTEEMTRWGFDVFGAAKGGELEMVSLGEDLHDSGIGTPSSKAASEVGDDEVKGAARKNRVKFLKKPEMMKDALVLKDYQLVGLNWLALLYKNKLSCILADDMGLGKSS